MVDAPAALHDLVCAAGFDVLEVRDATPEFRRAVENRLVALRTFERGLRREEGDEAVDEEVGKRERLLTGIEEGLIRRTLIAGIRVDGHLQTPAGVT